ncbi:MAG TPA: ABC transporter substrate-binding protein [Candidatus Binatia bacterium]
MSKLLSLSLVLWSLAGSAYAQSTKVVVASSGISPTQIVPYLAQEAGIFKKNGLDVALIRTRADVAVMSLLAGDTAINDVAGPTIIRSDLKGADGVFIAAGSVAFDLWLMTAKDIKTTQDLKGKILGVGSLSGSTLIVTRYVLSKIGLNPLKDVKLLQIGGTPDRLIALRAGRIHATLLSSPLSLAAQREGFNFLADGSGLAFQNNGPATTRKFIREHPDIVRKYVRSQVEAVHLMKTNREIWAKALAKYLRVERDALDRSYEIATTEELFPRKQYPSLDAIRVCLEQIAEDDPKAKSSKPENFVDASFVAELDKSGYIDGLYKNN